MSSAANARERRYVELTRRMHPTTNFGAMVIIALITASMTTWLTLAYAVGFHVAMYQINLLLNRLLASRRVDARIEIGRAVFNSGMSGIGYQLIAWPLATWFWLPYTALTFDASGGRRSLLVLAIMCGVQDAAALLGGVSPIYPITFTVLAFVAYRISNARLQIIRDMLVDAEDQRDELVHAHEALKAEVAARERAEIELRAAQKLEAIGRLAAGVAHEINTPMQFIGDSLHFVESGMADLLELADGVDPAKAEAADLPYLKANLPEAVALATNGVKRVAAIIRSMQQFVHPGHDKVGPTDLDAAIQDTLTICKHEYKLVADVVLELGQLPPVTCNGSEINQVFLNMIVNAAHAIGECVKGTDARGTITMRSRLDGSDAVIEISDTGCGIPDAVRDRIFEPFFTTKEIGRGTGQGLAIARAVIERHGGRLEFESTVGVGTTFTIVLPLERPRISMPAMPVTPETPQMPETQETPPRDQRLAS